MRRLILSGMVLALVAPAAMAQSRPPKGGPDRAVIEQAIKALGVPHEEMRGCMPRPERGKQPSAAERAKLEGQMLSCFREANPDLTEAQFHAAMQKLHPPRG